VIRYVSKGAKKYASYIDPQFNDLKIPLRIGEVVRALIKHKMFLLSTFIWMSWIRLTGKYNPLEKYYN
jgi:hypothetical protein